MGNTGEEPTLCSKINNKKLKHILKHVLNSSHSNTHTEKKPTEMPLRRHLQKRVKVRVFTQSIKCCMETKNSKQNRLV